MTKPGIAALSEKERRCLELRARHYSIESIAREMVMSPSTVESHLSSARNKLGAPDRSAAVRMMLESLADASTIPTSPDQRVPARPAGDHRVAGATSPDAPEPGAGERRNDLTTAERLVQIVKIIMVLPILILILVAVYSYSGQHQNRALVEIGKTLKHIF